MPGAIDSAACSAAPVFLMPRDQNLVRDERRFVPSERRGRFQSAWGRSGHKPFHSTFGFVGEFVAKRTPSFQGWLGPASESRPRNLFRIREPMPSFATRLLVPRFPDEHVKVLGFVFACFANCHVFGKKHIDGAVGIGTTGKTTCRAGSLSSWATTSRNPLVLWMEGAACPRQDIAVPAINSRVKTDRIRTPRRLQNPRIEKARKKSGHFQHCSSIAG